ncbi:MAG: sigma-70 family RNA polymerase sigma factor [Planctomycetes bacterium]|nr:sigma-70 family RNA polymerase sigma factor [Planctomycetota bacterium]MCB9884803.1 sigma-70 family RNA polymerase sigma factor [Planctomycetota bacterium]
MTTSPESLFAQFRAHGDPQALGAVFDRTSPQLLSLALHLCGNPADAEDALQATFVTAIARVHSWDASRPLLPWLFGILNLQCKKLGERRARRREAPLPHPELLLDDGSPVAANERRELVGKLREHIDRMPQEQRQVLLLQLEHGLSPAEVAEVLGVPPGTVRMRLHRAVKALRGSMPAGLFTLLLAALPTRGLAAVRAAVLREVTTGGGAVLAKKTAVALAAFVVMAVGWLALAPFGSRAEPELPVAAATVAAVEQSGSAKPSAPTTEPRQQRDLVPTPESIAAGEAEASSGTLHIRCLYRGSGAPLLNLPLRVCPVRGDVDPESSLATAVTGADGTCTVNDLPTGPVSVETIGGLAESSAVRAQQVTEVTLTFDPDQMTMITVRGRVVHGDGRSAGGATIVAASQGRRHTQPIGRADSRGWFEVRMASRFLLVGARLAGFAPSASRATDDSAEIELVLPGPGATIAGVVIDPQGLPVADATVEIGGPREGTQWRTRGGWLEEAPAAQHLRTDALGRFVASDLPAQEIGVSITADSFAPFHAYANPRAGETLPLRCELACGRVVIGHIVDESGTPVAGAYATLGDAYRKADDDGRFGFRDLPAGPLWLRVEGPQLVPATFERAAEATGDWQIVVHRRRPFLLRLVDENGAPLVGWRVELRSADSQSTITASTGLARVMETDAGLGSLWLAPPGSLQAIMPWPLPPQLVPEVEATIVVPTSRQPTAQLRGAVLAPDGAPLIDGMLEVRGADDSYLYRQRLQAGRFHFEQVPAGDWVIEVHRAGRGSAGGRFWVRGLRPGEVRDLGALQLPAEGTLSLRVVLADGSEPRDPAVFLFDAEEQEHPAPPRDGRPHAWPAGRYRWLVMQQDSRWQGGRCEVRAGQSTNLEIVLQPAVRRYLEFPMPVPAWGAPERVDYVLYAPDGSAYDRGDFDPRTELPLRYMPPLWPGAWRLELTTNDGQRFAGSFELATMAPSRDPIRVAVQPAR